MNELSVWTHLLFAHHLRLVGHLVLLHLVWCLALLEVGLNYHRNTNHALRCLHQHVLDIGSVSLLEDIWIGSIALNDGLWVLWLYGVEHLLMLPRLQVGLVSEYFLLQLRQWVILVFLNILENLIFQLDLVLHTLVVDIVRHRHLIILLLVRTTSCHGWAGHLHRLVHHGLWHGLHLGVGHLHVALRLETSRHLLRLLHVHHIAISRLNDHLRLLCRSCHHGWMHQLALTLNHGLVEVGNLLVLPRLHHLHGLHGHLLPDRAPTVATVIHLLKLMVGNHQRQNYF